MTDVKKSEMLSNVEKFLHMTDVKQSKIYPVFLQSKLFCCNLRNLRNFTLRKIKLKVVYVESFGQLKKFVLKSFIVRGSRFREFFCSGMFERFREFPKLNLLLGCF